MGQIRAFYASAFIALGSLLPILALALEDRGFTPGQYAWLLALQPAMRIVGPPFWGALADRFAGTARLLRFNAWLAASAMVVLAANLPPGWTLAAIVVWAVVTTSLVPLADAGAHALLGPRGADFGRVRVFGSMGFMFAATLIGLTGVGEGFRFSFALASVGYLCAGIAAGGFPADATFGRVGLGREAKEHLARREVKLLLLGVGAYYVGHGIYDVYYGLHVVSATGLTAGEVSWLWALGVLVEIPVVFFAPRLLERYGSDRLLVFAALVAVGRWGLLTQVTSAWQVWVLQPFHGVTFGVWYLAYIHENQRMAPPALRATVQGMGAASLGGGMVLGTLIGGPLIEEWGTAAAFGLASMGAACACVLYLVRWRTNRPPAIELPQGAE